jgi:hypothetical protein
MLSEPITKEIGNAYYNMEKAVEYLVESNVSRGISHQQYTISSANKLADMLSDVLNSMQMSLSGSGQGKPKPSSGKGEMQLPDIMMKQKGLGDKMKDGMKKGEESGNKEGEGKDGESGEKQGKKSGQKLGQSGSEGEGGEGGKDWEGNAKEIMEIYKEQRQLREALQKELNKKGMSGNGQNALDAMKDIEKQLLNQGFKNETLQKALNLNYEFLKLDKAMQQQGEEEKRQAEVNTKQFDGSKGALTPELKEYLNSIEILNRQSLPLRSNFSLKVKEYFNTND